MGYTREKLLNICEQAIKTPEIFYKFPCKSNTSSGKEIVNLIGQTTDTSEKYTEVIAEFLKENMSELKKIKQITREKNKKSYYRKTHDGNYHNDKIEEKRLAKELFKDGGVFPFRIIDYQTPLKNSSEDNGVGEIDLLAVDDNNVYILELKRKDSCETMLRCVLEAYTYARIVNKEKLISDFVKAGILKPQRYNLKIAPLVFMDKNQHKEMLDEKSSKKLKELMQMLGKDEKWGEEYVITPYYIFKKDGKYTIVKG